MRTTMSQQQITAFFPATKAAVTARRASVRDVAGTATTTSKHALVGYPRSPTASQDLHDTPPVALRPLRTRIEESIFWSTPASPGVATKDDDDDEHYAFCNADHQNVSFHGNPGVLTPPATQQTLSNTMDSQQRRKRKISTGDGPMSLGNIEDFDHWPEDDDLELDNANSTGPCGSTLLVDDVWTHMFTLMDYETLSKMYAVCRRFRLLANAPLIWSRLCARHNLPVRNAQRTAQNEYSDSSIPVLGSGVVSYLALNEFYRFITTGSKCAWVPKMDEVKLPAANAYKKLFDRFARSRHAFFTNEPRCVSRQGHEHGTMCVVPSVKETFGGETKILTAGYDGAVRLWELRKREVYSNHMVSPVDINHNDRSGSPQRKLKTVSSYNYSLQLSRIVCQHSGQMSCYCIAESDWCDQLILAGRLPAPVIVDICDHNVSNQMRLPFQVGGFNPVTSLTTFQELLFMNGNNGSIYVINETQRAQVCIIRHTSPIVSVMTLKRWNLLLVVTEAGDLMFCDLLKLHELLSQRTIPIVQFDLEQITIGRCITSNDNDNRTVTATTVVAFEEESKIYVPLSFNTSEVLLLSMDFIEGDCMMDSDSKLLSIDMLGEEFLHESRGGSVDFSIKPEWTITGSNSTSCLSYSKKGRFIVVGRVSGALDIVSIEPMNTTCCKPLLHKHINPSSGNNSCVLSVLVLEKDNLIITGAKDGSLLCWQF